MSRRTLSRLWIAAGLVALLLGVATIGLASRARVKAILGSTVYLTGEDRFIQVRAQPSQTAPVAAVLGHGTPVNVTDATTAGGQTWYHVSRGERRTGWVQAQHTSRSSPRSHDR